MNITREKLLNHLFELRNTETNKKVKIITGIRGCGKSSLIDMYTDFLQNMGTARSHIINLDFELLRYDPICSEANLFNYLSSKIEDDAMHFIFFQHIRYAENIVKIIDSLSAYDNTDIYITISASYFIEEQIPRMFLASTVIINILPLSFEEYSAYMSAPVFKTSAAYAADTGHNNTSDTTLSDSLHSNVSDITLSNSLHYNTSDTTLSDSLHSNVSDITLSDSLHYSTSDSSARFISEIIQNNTSALSDNPQTTTAASSDNPQTTTAASSDNPQTTASTSSDTPQANAADVFFPKITKKPSNNSPSPETLQEHSAISYFPENLREHNFTDYTFNNASDLYHNIYQEGYQNIDQNIYRGGNQNIDQEIYQRMGQNTKQGIYQDMDQNINQNIYQDDYQNINQNYYQDGGQNVYKNTFLNYPLNNSPSAGQVVSDFNSASGSYEMPDKVSYEFAPSAPSSAPTAKSTSMAAYRQDLGIMMQSYMNNCSPASEKILGLYNKYIQDGGFPYVAYMRSTPASAGNTDSKRIKQLSQDKIVDNYIRGIYNNILIHNLVPHRQISDTDILEYILYFISDHLGEILSPKKISDILRQAGRPVNTRTIDSYLDALAQTFLIYRAGRYDIVNNTPLKTLEKCYLADTGLRSHLFGITNKYDSLPVLENQVYLELLRKGYKIYLGKLGSLEISFIASRTDFQTDRIYIQVLDSIENTEKLTGVLKTYKKLHDNYPKYVISSSSICTNIEGIKHLPICHFLLQFA